MTLQGTIQNGVVVLDGSAKLPDGTPVTVWVSGSKAAPVITELQTADERNRVLAIGRRIAALPDENPGDTFSGSDHDQVLYGEP
jgi:hypothetical protein